MLVLSHAGRMLLAAAVVCSSSISVSAAPQPPPILTPAGVGITGAVIYELPYAISGRVVVGTIASPFVSETVVTIGNPNITTCRVQVDWRDWDNVQVGFSGPVALAPQFTFEFTSMPVPVTFPTPYGLNVFRSQDISFEGHAKIRSPNCSNLRIDAQAVQATPQGELRFIDPIKVVRPGGNVGD